MAPVLFVLIALAAQAAPPAPESDAPAAPGTEIWQGARIGMTPAQVRAVFPAARVVQNGESLVDNAKLMLTLPGVRMRTGERATANFYFRGDSLNEVHLDVDAPSGQTQANIKRAGVISQSLIPVFGKPAEKCGPRQGLLAFECDWPARHGLSVSVTYMDVAGQSPLLEQTIRGVVASDQPARAPDAQATPGPGAPRKP